MRDLLTEEIGLEFGELPNMAMGSPEYEKTIAGLTKLMTTQIELEKFEAEKKLKENEQKAQEELNAAKLAREAQEREDRVESQRQQLELQQKQLDLQKKQARQNMWGAILQVAATVGLGIGTIVLSVWGTHYTMEYEDKGVMPTTLAGKEHTKKLFSKK